MFKPKPSPAQLAANRANAQKSTGPITPEGKERSRCNALRHGLTAHVTVMTDPDRDAQEKFLKSHLASLAPDGFHETQLAQSIAHDQWRMNRIRAIEENAFSSGLTSPAGNLTCEHPEIHSALAYSGTFFNDPEDFSTLSLYEQRLHRNYHRNLKLYRELQKERLANQHFQTPQPDAKPLTRAAGASPASASSAENQPEPNVQPTTPSATSKEIGFDRSNWNVARPSDPPPAPQNVAETPIKPEIPRRAA